MNEIEMNGTKKNGSSAKKLLCTFGICILIVWVIHVIRGQQLMNEWESHEDGIRNGTKSEQSVTQDGKDKSTGVNSSKLPEAAQEEVLVPDHFYVLRDGRYKMIDSQLRTGIENEYSAGDFYDAGILDEPTNITVDRRYEQLITTFDIAEISAREVWDYGWVSPYVFDPSESNLFGNRVEVDKRLDVFGIMEGEEREIDWIDEVFGVPITDVDMIEATTGQRGIFFIQQVKSSPSLYYGDTIYIFTAQEKGYIDTGIYENMKYKSFNMPLDKYIYMAYMDEEDVCSVQRTKNGYYIIDTSGLPDGTYIFGIGGQGGYYTARRTLGSDCFVVHLTGGNN